MSVTVSTSGTLTTTTTASGYNLVSATAQGVYQFVFDAGNMKGSATADWMEISIFGRPNSSTASDHLIDVYTMVGRQTQQMFRSQPYVSPHYLLVNVFHKTFCSTGTDFIWALYLVT